MEKPPYAGLEVQVPDMHKGPYPGLEVHTPRDKPPYAGLEALPDSDLEAVHSGHHDYHTAYLPYPTERLQTDDAPPPKARICGLSKALFWVVLAATALAILAIALGVGLGVGLRDANQTTADASAASTTPTVVVTVTVSPTSTSIISSSTSTSSASVTSAPTNSIAGSPQPIATSIAGTNCTGGTVREGETENYVGLCTFTCQYGYCPVGPCVCTSYGTSPSPPETNGRQGCPLPGESDGYLGLCSYACNHGYCPDTACRYC